MQKFYFICILFFTTSLLGFGQNDAKKIRTEFVFAYGQASYSNLEIQNPIWELVYQETSRRMTSYSVGTNLSYSFSNKLKLVSGTRLHAIHYGATRIHPYFYSRGSGFCGTGLRPHQVSLTEYYLEIPLRIRYFFHKKNFVKIYAEAGIQEQIYLRSHLRIANSSSNSDKARDDFSSSYTSASLSIGAEFSINPKRSFFVQGIINKAFLGSQTLPTQNPLLGLETGIRF